MRHGLTLGELARLFNTEREIGAEIEVVAMRGWRRETWFDQTGLRWVDPSPNMRNLHQVLLYPGIGAIEGSNLSVGRGTDTRSSRLGRRGATVPSWRVRSTVDACLACCVPAAVSAEFEPFRR